MTERKEINEERGVIFVLYDGNKIQLEERIKKEDRFYGYTIVPGGKVEFGETLQAALIREVNEEYGVAVLKNKELGTVQDIEESGRVCIRHVYLVSQWEGNLSNPEGKNKHTEATFQQARIICKNDISQRILNLVEKNLFT